MRLALSYDALKTYGTPDAARDVPDRDREVDRMGLAFDDAWTRDEQQRTAAAHREPGKLNRLHAP